MFYIVNQDIHTNGHLIESIIMINILMKTQEYAVLNVIYNADVLTVKSSHLLSNFLLKKYKITSLLYFC